MQKTRTEAAPAARNAQTVTFAARVEEVEWFRSFGIHPAHIASALGLKPAALERYFRRARRTDLANLFSPDWTGTGSAA